MAKGKSSASSATRKKHARKAAGPQGAEEHLQVPTKEKKTKGKKSKEPRKKVYIPPVKPAPVQPDPLDTLGIAQRISAELLVVLRKLAKKDQVTKRRALEDLQADWLEKAKKDGDVLSQLVEALPVWVCLPLPLVSRTAHSVCTASPCPLVVPAPVATHPAAFNFSSLISSQSTQPGSRADFLLPARGCRQ